MRLARRSLVLAIVAMPRIASAQQPAPVAPAQAAPADAPAPLPPLPALPPSAPAPATPPPAVAAPAATPGNAPGAPEGRVVIPGPSREQAIAAAIGPQERATTWDMNLDLGYGRVFSDPGHWSTFGRIRAGIMHVHDTLYFSLGATYDLSSLSPATFGVQGEILHLESGFWGQIGGFIGTPGGHPGAMVAAGVSLIGIEAQARSYDDIGSAGAVYLKLRIPVGIIAYALSRKK